MDAISFVMGEKTQSLRVKRLADLIHGASINRPVANRASVSAIFVNDADGTETIFTRSIIGSSSDHKINNEPVSSQEYLQKLDELGINVNAKNFLVFQVCTVTMLNSGLPMVLQKVHTKNMFIRLHSSMHVPSNFDII